MLQLRSYAATANCAATSMSGMRILSASTSSSLVRPTIMHSRRMHQLTSSSTKATPTSSLSFMTTTAFASTSSAAVHSIRRIQSLDPITSSSFYSSSSAAATLTPPSTRVHAYHRSAYSASPFINITRGSKRLQSSQLPHRTIHTKATMPTSFSSPSSSSPSPPSSHLSHPLRRAITSLLQRVKLLARPFSSNSDAKIPASLTDAILAANTTTAPPPPPSSSSAATASPHSSSMSSPLFDVSHLVSGLEEKRERLRCLEVDDSGNYRDVEFSRGELGAMLELHPRDLRFLDATMRNLPSILARRRVIIVNLEMFKALITADRILMFDPWYPHVQSVVQPLQAAVLSGGELFEGKPVPFEFIALEHILLTVCRNFEDRFDLYMASLEPLLSSSPSSTPPPSSSKFPSLGLTPTTNPLHEGSASTLMHLLQLKNSLSSFEVTLRETGEAIKELSETDEDMAEMYLTEKSQGKYPVLNAHSEVEIILETYYRKVDELENEVEQNVKSITLTEEHIQIRLDANRNSIMKLELLVSISTLGVTTAALGAGLFGMNLPNHFETSPYAFPIVTGLFFLCSTILIRSGIRMCAARGIDLWRDLDHRGIDINKMSQQQQQRMDRHAWRLHKMQAAANGKSIQQKDAPK